MHVRTSFSLAGCLAAAALVTSLAANAGPNIVQNGGFETCNFTGWTQFGNTEFTGVDGVNPQSGACAAFFGPTSANGAGGISQTLATSPGDYYTISFGLANEADILGFSAPNSVSVTWDGLPPLLSLTDAPAFGYQNYSFIVQATAATTTLTFTFTHDPAFWDLDNVSAIPEPGSLALVALGASLLGFARRRRA